MLNLRELIHRVEYGVVGSSFEAQWLLFLLNQRYYPAQCRERLRLKPPALLKLNLNNRFPRCYPTRRLTQDGSLYYGPFPSQAAAERFASEFLDFFKVRRCVEDLDPNPTHPGCVYSQMRMCLAPCFAGCTDAEYQNEVGRVVEFLDAQGLILLRSLEADRSRASEALEFEQAAKIHRKIEKVNEVLRQKPELTRNLRDLHAVVVQRGAEPKSVAFFRVSAGEICGPANLSLDENVSSPVPLDEQLHKLLDSRAIDAPRDKPSKALRESPLGPCASPQKFEATTKPASPPSAQMQEGVPTHVNDPTSQRGRGVPCLPPWEHLSLLARWYYSSFREGELVMLNPDQTIPHSRLIRICRKLLATA